MSVEEKRVYAPDNGGRELFVASADGLVRVGVAADHVGEFGLLDRRTAFDIGTVDGRTLVATEEGILDPEAGALLEAGERGSSGPPNAGIDRAPVIAVSDDGGVRIAVREYGRVERGGERVGAVESVDGHHPRAAGAYVGTSGGLYRVSPEDGCSMVRSGAVADIAVVDGCPVVATFDGVLAGDDSDRELTTHPPTDPDPTNWGVLATGEATMVKSTDGRLHATVDGRLHSRIDGSLAPVDGPRHVVDVVLDDWDGAAVTYAVTADGRLHARQTGTGRDWRSWPLGVSHPRSIAVWDPVRQ